MPHLTLSLRRATLADRFFGRGLAIDAMLVATGAALTSIMAQITIPAGLIPITAQSLSVLFVGMCLGSLRGALALVLYTAAGALGLPIFSDGASGPDHLLGPTGGYLLGYIAAAVVVGWIAERGLDQTFPRAFASAALGTLTIYLFGLPWLAAANDYGIETILAVGVYPFLAGSMIKIGMVALAVTAFWSALQRAERYEATLERGEP